MPAHAARKRLDDELHRQALRLAVHYHSLSYRQLARLAGVSHGRAGDWMLGRRPIPVIRWRVLVLLLSPSSCPECGYGVNRDSIPLRRS